MVSGRYEQLFIGRTYSANFGRAEVIEMVDLETIASPCGTADLGGDFRHGRVPHHGLESGGETGGHPAFIPQPSDEVFSFRAIYRVLGE